jgi:hypothetical protein
MPHFLGVGPAPIADLAVGEVSATVAKTQMRCVNRSKDEPHENREKPPAAINSA